MSLNTRLAWKTNPSPEFVYAEITRRMWLHANPETGQWWMSHSADSSHCDQDPITYGHAKPIRDEQLLVAVEAQASAELHRIANSIVM